MNTPSGVRFAALKLREALETVRAAYTLQEGLYSAYVNHLQWLGDVEELPDDVQASLRGLIGELTQMPGSDAVTSARATVASLSEDRAGALVERLIDLTLLMEASANGRDND